MKWQPNLTEVCTCVHGSCDRNGLWFFYLAYDKMDKIPCISIFGGNRVISRGQNIIKDGLFWFGPVIKWFLFWHPDERSLFWMCVCVHVCWRKSKEMIAKESKESQATKQEIDRWEASWILSIHYSWSSRSVSPLSSLLFFYPFGL